MVTKKGVLLGSETARRVVDHVRQRHGGHVPARVKRPNSASGVRFFLLMEDFDGDGPAKAHWVSRTDNTSRGVFDVVCYGNIFSGAPAGYKGIVQSIDGEWVPPVNDCIVSCPSAGSITPGTAPGGTVGQPYAGHTVSSSGLDGGSLAISGLPPGVSGTVVEPDVNISGTPTQAGTYYAIVTGTADKTGGSGEKCTITKVVTIEIGV